MAKGNGDIALRAARGLLPGWSVYVWRGHNPDVDSAAAEDVVEWGGSVQYLDAAETVSVVSASTDDDVGGTGVTAIQIAGIDANGFELIEVVTMDGTDAVTTTGEFLRINTMTAAASGTGGTNAGVITATASTTGYVMGEIDAGDGISHQGIYTVPAGKRATFGGADINIIKASGTNPVVRVKIFVRASSATPWLNLFEMDIDTSIHNFVSFESHNKAAFGPGVEARVEATTTANNTEVRTRLYLIIGPNDVV